MTSQRTAFEPRLVDLAAAEEQVLKARLAAILATIDHNTEKGNASEAAVTSLLRSFLPAEYGLRSGFVAWRSPEDPDRVRMTSQLDLVIYDALRGAPIADLGSSAVFPLESVYGYVEVKTTMRDDTLEECLRQSNRLREPVTRWFWEATGTTEARLRELAYPSMRSYVVALRGDPPRLAHEECAKITEKRHATWGRTFLSAWYIGGVGFFRSIPGTMNLEGYADSSLARFKNHMLHSLARYPRYQAELTPAVDQYYPDLDGGSVDPGSPPALAFRTD